MNPIGIVTELRNKHNEGMVTGGINVKNGTISDMWEEKIVQPLLVNTSEIALATECVGKKTNLFPIFFFKVFFFLIFEFFLVSILGMILKIGKLEVKSYFNAVSLILFIYLLYR
jgi:hypothetical protein